MNPMQPACDLEGKWKASGLAVSKVETTYDIAGMQPINEV